MAWAVQVDVSTLGAHLEAYVNLLPTCNTLKACNRYGKGPQATVDKLPTELISYIEDFLAQDERVRLRKVWNTDFKCFQQLCNPIDHLSEVELEPLFELARKREIPRSDFSYPFEEDADRVDAHIGDELDLWMDVHHARSFSWEGRVGRQGAARRGLFSAHESLITKHFGLETWISHLRTREYQFENFWGCMEIHPPETTCAWLKLPGARENFNASSLTKDERDEKDFMLESGYGMQVKMPKPLTDSARSRFKRMMKILDLWPYAQWGQWDPPLTADEGEDRCIEDSTADSEHVVSAEPQLTMLMRCITRSDEED